MTSINIRHARAGLSRLIERVLAGEDVVITRRGKPAVRLVPVEREPKRKPGALKGLFEVSDEFFELLPEDVIEAFYNSAVFPEDGEPPATDT
jgi:prevent-host-death family protein